MTANQLRSVRINLGKGVVEMAEECGISTRAWYQYEQGVRPVPKVLETLLVRLYGKHKV